MQMIKRLLQISLLICISSIVSACAGNVADEPDTELATETSIPTETPLPTSTPTPQPSASPTATLQPSPTIEVLSEDKFSSLSGLLYTSDNAIWTIDTNGQMQQLYDCFGSTRVSPDGRQSLVNQDLDIWILDHETCTSRNVTNTSGDEEAYENGALWWPGRPGRILIGYSGGDFAFGIPIEVNIANGETAPLSENISSAVPSFSPDGRKFVFETSLKDAFIYDVSSGLIELEIPEEIAKIGSPAWSHDGQSIAWIAGIDDEGNQHDGRTALVIFDIVSGDVQILDSYSPLGRDGWPFAPMWSPNDEWVIYNAWADESDKSGIWVVNSIDPENIYLPIDFEDRYANLLIQKVVWSADGKHLIISNYAPDPSDTTDSFWTEVWLVTIDTWEMQKVEALSGARIIDWQ